MKRALLRAMEEYDSQIWVKRLHSIWIRQPARNQGINLMETKLSQCLLTTKQLYCKMSNKTTVDKIQDDDGVQIKLHIFSCHHSSSDQMAADNSISEYCCYSVHIQCSIRRPCASKRNMHQ